MWLGKFVFAFTLSISHAVSRASLDLIASTTRSAHVHRDGYKGICYSGPSFVLLLQFFTSHGRCTKQSIDHARTNKRFLMCLAVVLSIWIAYEIFMKRRSLLEMSAVSSVWSANTTVRWDFIFNVLYISVFYFCGKQKLGKKKDERKEVIVFASSLTAKSWHEEIMHRGHSCGRPSKA